jgi:hypothetical protein
MIARTLILFLAAFSAVAADVRVAWDLSPGAVNYWVKWGTNAVAPAFAQNAGTNLTATLTNLAAGRWFATATAVSAQGIESDPSNVLMFDVPSAPMLRLQLQSANTIDGPWSNLASVGVQSGMPSAFFRLEAHR